MLRWIILAFILSVLPTIQLVCALVVPFKHQFAHELHRQGLLQHHHYHDHAALLNLGTSVNPSPKPKNVTWIGGISSQAGHRNSVAAGAKSFIRAIDTLTIRFEAVPVYPQTGAEERRISLPLTANGVSDTIQVSPLTYGIQFAEAVSWSEGVKSEHPQAGSILCQLKVEQDLHENGETPTPRLATLSFSQASGMVSLPADMRAALKLARPRSSLTCGMPNAEL